MIAIATTERNGRVVAATLVHEHDEIMLITTGGVLIRTRVSEIREMGRATQGVTLIALDEGTRLSGLQRVVETDVEHPAANGSGATPGGADPAAGGPTSTDPDSDPTPDSNPEG
jgi:DNA gyrase subunit A